MTLFLRPLLFANDRQIKNVGIFPVGIYVTDMKCFRSQPIRFCRFKSRPPGAALHDISK